MREGGELGLGRPGTSYFHFKADSNVVVTYIELFTYLSSFFFVFTHLFNINTSIYNVEIMIFMGLFYTDFCRLWRRLYRC